jgi:hypothetical protein
MATTVAPTLPPAASAALDAFRDALLKADTANIVCIAVYGSAARIEPANSNQRANGNSG